MTPQGKPDSQPKLLVERRFLPFFITQFLGAFNDNVFKNALIILIAFQGAQFTDINTHTLTNLSAGLFILPFFLFSATAGQLIDKTEKSLSMRRIKMLEIVIMLFAAWAFIQGELFWLIALLFLMGSQSSLFGPAKYSYIPQHLDDSELIAGNALVQMGTFVAILIGTMAGGLLIAEEEGREQDEWGVTAIPHNTAEPVQNIYGGDVMITATTPEQQLAAWIFTKWFTSPEVQAEWVDISGYFPTRAGTNEFLTGYDEENPQWAAARDLLPFAYYEPQLISYQGTRDAAEEAFNAIMQGADIQATLDELTETANELQEELMSEVP